MKKLLVPIDGSEGSMKALDKAIELGLNFQSEIYVISVIPEVYLIDQVPNAYTYVDGINDTAIDMTTKILDSAKEKLKDYPYPTSAHYEVGNIAREILSFADEQDIDLIVMGNRGLGAFSRTFLGSISNKVINQSHIDVLVVKSLTEV